MKYNKAICAAVFIFIFMLSGCSDKKVVKYNTVYKGDNTLWTAEYRVTGTGIFTKDEDGTHRYDNKIKYFFEADYQGDLEDLSSIKSIRISYSCSSNSGTCGGSSIGLGKFVIESGESSGAVPRKDEKIKVTINIDGDIQTFELEG